MCGEKSKNQQRGAQVSAKGTLSWTGYWIDEKKREEEEKFQKVARKNRRAGGGSIIGAACTNRLRGGKSR